MSQAEFGGLPDFKGPQSSPSCSPYLKSISPPPSPHSGLPFNCPEIHRSACLSGTHGSQRKGTGREREKHPQALGGGPGPPLPRPGSPKLIAGFCVLHTLRKIPEKVGLKLCPLLRSPGWMPQEAPSGPWEAELAFCLPRGYLACFQDSLNSSGFYLVLNLSLGKTLPAEGDPVSCPQRRVQPLQPRGGFSLTPRGDSCECLV